MGRCLVAVVVAVSMGWPAGAAAAGRWSQPVAVAHPARTAEVVDAVICGGDAVVAWEDFDVVGTGRTTTTERFALWVASAAIGQGFGASQLLDRTDHGPDAAVAASPAGWCAVAWQTGRTVRIVLRPPGGTFGAPVTVAEALPVAPVRVGIDDSGSATVLWSEFGTPPSLTGPVRAATVTPGGAVAIHDLGGEVLPGSWLALAVGAAGQAVAAWSVFPGPPGQGRDDARVALRPAGGQFGPVTTFADPAASLFIARASIDGSGRATVAVQRARHGLQPGDPGAVEILQGSADGGWGAPQGLDANVQARNVHLVSNPGGDRAATWDINPLDDREINASRVAPAPAGQPFGPLLLTPIPTADAIPGASVGDVPSGAALDGAGETLVLWDGPSRGLQIHPVSPTAQAGPAEAVLADACAGGGGRLAVAPFSTVAAIAYQGRPHGLWVAYRDAGTPAPEAAPRICELRWSPALRGAHRAPAGPIRLYLRLSKPTTRLVVTVRDRHRRVLSSRRLGPRPAGYTSLALRGRHARPSLPAGRYRVTATATDAAGRRSPATAINLRVVRPEALRSRGASRGAGPSGD